MTTTVATATVTTRLDGSDRVHVNFVGGQDHPGVRPVQAGTVWL